MAATTTLLNNDLNNIDERRKQRNNVKLLSPKPNRLNKAYGKNMTLENIAVDTTIGTINTVTDGFYSSQA